MINKKQKKLFQLFFIILSIYFSAGTEELKTSTQNQIQDLGFHRNLMTSQSFFSEDVKNLSIETTFETLEFLEIYGTEISIDVYSNNNTILPKITKKNKTLSIKSSVITESKKNTPGDKCKIIIYLPKDIWLDNLNIFYAPELFSQKKLSSQQQEFTIPKIKSLNTTIETINANITGKNLTGSIIIKTNTGNITIENIMPTQITSSLKINNEDVQFYAITNTGNITLSNFTGHYLSLKTKNNITARNIAPEIFEIKTSEGNTVATFKNSPIATSQINSKSGNIQLFMPKNASYSINITSPRGTFIDKIQDQRKNRPHAITKQYNDGGPTINLETIKGTIELENF